MTRTERGDGRRSAPRVRTVDGALDLLRDGYRYISRRCDRYGTDLFRTRMMLDEAVCVRGAEAARLLYDRDRFTRRGAMPSLVLRLLQDRGSVQQLDGEAHHRRKAMFLAMMSDAEIARLQALAREEWLNAVGRWETVDEIVLHDEIRSVLCRAVCRWAGLQQADGAYDRRTREMAAMIDGAGSFGPRNWKGQILRLRSERWACKTLAHLRDDPLLPRDNSPAAMIVRHRDSDGRPLDLDAAAVELLNILRPTVAVARYVVFIALALHDYPECGIRLTEDDGAYLDAFVQEVRRFYPFFPMVGGRALQPVTCHGYAIDRGEQVFLDLYGTNHHPELWDEPERFRPERFIGREPDPNALVPQGGGDHATGHRCPGEWITLALMRQAATMLARELDYEVPDQDLGVSLRDMPALPESGFRIRAVRRRAS